MALALDADLRSSDVQMFNDSGISLLHIGLHDGQDPFIKIGRVEKNHILLDVSRDQGPSITIVNDKNQPKVQPRKLVPK